MCVFRGGERSCFKALASRAASGFFVHYGPTLQPAALCGVTKMVSLWDTVLMEQNEIFHNGLEETIFY